MTHYIYHTCAQTHKYNLQNRSLHPRWANIIHIFKYVTYKTQFCNLDELLFFNSKNKTLYVLIFVFVYIGWILVKWGIIILINLKKKENGVSLLVVDILVESLSNGELLLINPKEEEKRGSLVAVGENWEKADSKFSPQRTKGQKHHIVVDQWLATKRGSVPIPKRN